MRFSESSLPVVEAVLAVSGVLVGLLPTANAAVPCETDDDCEEKLRPGSVCKVVQRESKGKDEEKSDEAKEERYCTNPFSSGCLCRILGEEKFPKKRMCNSDDAVGSDNEASSSSGACSPSLFDYTEIRISPGNWESTMFLAWIMQIVLSELADVPATIDTGAGRTERPLSFYDEDNAFNYPAVISDFEALETANSLHRGDCSLTSKPCAHILPEVWQNKRLEAVKEKRFGIDQQYEMDGNGMVGAISWYVPSFVVDMDPSLTGWKLGLSGEANRERLARTFLRPTMWGEYCREVSPTNCSGSSEFVSRSLSEVEVVSNTADAFAHSNEEMVTRKAMDDTDELDEAATRPPKDDKESRMYHHPEAYKGHFRFTDQNNCSIPGNEQKCTGHFIDYPCSWQAFTESQIYWSEMAFDKSVPGKPDGYSYSDILQIFAASNATKSPAMFVWWYPHEIIDKYNLQPVSLPKTTTECIQKRPNVMGTDNTETGGRCGLSLTTALLGEKMGSCGYVGEYLLKVLSSSLEKNYFVAENDADRSPAYMAMRNVEVTNIEMDDILKAWDKREIDKYGYDPREAVCSWVAKNLVENRNLTSIIPAGYPRKIKKLSYDSSTFLRAAIVFASVTVLLILMTLALTNWFRREMVIQHAQIHFLQLFCLGYLLVAIGAAVQATDPTNGTCVAREWLTVTGYTIGIVPLLVKITAINKIMQQANKMKRVAIPRRRLWIRVGMAVLVIVTFLLVWTVVDPPARITERVLVSPGLVEERHACASSSVAWKAAAFGWEGLYVFCAAILAFVSRDVRQEFNESRQVGNMAYSHSLFLIMRLLVQYVLPSAGVDPLLVAGVTSFLLSADSVASLSLYFGPKLWAIWQRHRQGTGIESNTTSSAYTPRWWQVMHPLSMSASESNLGKSKRHSAANVSNTLEAELHPPVASAPVDVGSTNQEEHQQKPAMKSQNDSGHITDLQGQSKNIASLDICSETG